MNTWYTHQGEPKRVRSTEGSIAVFFHRNCEASLLAAQPSAREVDEDVVGYRQHSVEGFSQVYSAERTVTVKDVAACHYDFVILSCSCDTYVLRQVFVSMRW